MTPRGRCAPQLYEVGGGGEPLEALRLEVMSGANHVNHYFLMVVTTTRCFVYSASGSLDALFYIQGMQVTSHCVQPTPYHPSPPTV